MSRIAIVALATTISVELLQLTVVAGRDASLRDVLTNTIGGILGAVAGRHVGALLLPDRRLAARLAAAWGALWVAVHVGTSFGEVPSFPHSRYFGQIAPDLGQFDQFRGEVVGASADAHDFPSGPQPVFDTLQAEWRARRGLTLRADVVAPAHSTRRLAPIISIFDEHEREIVVLGQLRRSLVIALRSRGEAAKLRPIVVGLGGVFPGGAHSLAEPGDTVRLTADWVDGRARLTATSGRGTRSLEARIGPALAWYAALPFDVSIVDLWWVSLAWLVATLAPLGYWTARTERSLAAAPMIAAALAVALAAAPSVAGVSMASVAEWSAALGGVALGWCVGFAVHRAELASARREVA